MLPEHLPVHALLPQLRDALREQSTLILQAPPGAGKTTLVPLALLDCDWLRGRKILMLQPRRLAAKNAALRMASLLDEKVGKTVGYRMRMDTRVGADTRIEVVTEGVLLRMLQTDPALEDVGVVIFDEFHERSLDADLGLALALKSRETFGEDAAFRVLVMSATLAGETLDAFLGAPRLISEGRLYPVEVHYGPARKPRERFIDRLVQLLPDVLRRHPESSVLVFLPGQGEIRRVADAFHPPPGLDVHTLYGDLSLTDQQLAIAAPAGDTRKLVLATNIAETSLTIDGVDVVIDCGLERIPAYDPNTGMSRLRTVNISRASAEQRRGRAGRLRPGHCYRLWSEQQQQELAPQQQPEIENADLAGLALQLLAWGINDPGELRWLTPPGSGAYQQALDLLEKLAAIDRRNAPPRLTRHGSAMAELPLHPRLAHMLLRGQEVGARETAALIAADLNERTPSGRLSPDMSTRLEYLTGEARCPAELRGWEHRVGALARDFLRLLPDTGVTSLLRPRREQLCAYLLALAYPDRIARLRHSGGYQLANGRSCQFDGPSLPGKQKWLAVAEVSGSGGKRSDIIRSAAGLDAALFDGPLAELINTTTRVEWDTKSGRFIAEEQRRCGTLILARKTLQEVSDEARVEKLLTMIRESKLGNLNWDSQAQSFLQRARLMATLDADWPAFDEDSLIAELSDWLGPFLASVRRIADLKKVDLQRSLQNRLNWSQREKMDRWLPLRLSVPSGSSIGINYDESPPVLAVKLQEMFGCSDAPTIADGRLPLTVHLLSPAGRPLQVTRDLGSFWRNSYAEVKKEMRGRYPKHPWPDDPLSAAATRHSKRRSPGP